MRKDLHLALLFPLLLVVLLASAAFPPGVRADDPTPPPPDGTTITTPEPAGIESTPTPTATLGAPTSDVSPTDAALTPMVAQVGAITLLAATGVVVLDSDGNEVPLASTEAAEIIAVGDPIWCPTGHLPGDPQCTSAQATIAALIADLAAVTGAGTIYFTSSYSTNDATLDHNNASLTNLTDLTIQGGWNGLTGVGFDLSGATEFAVTLSILNWSGDVTLNDLIFNTTGSDGVYVTTSGSIGLDEVESKGNNGRGAYLNNTSGGTAVGVTVNDSSFHDNLTGLDIYSYGDISLANMDASHNVGAGALIEDSENVRIARSDFSWNGLYGLGIVAADDVSLSDVEARHNGSDGTWILGGGDVTIDTANFDRNAGYGLDAWAGNMLSATDVQASDNDASGLLLFSDHDVTLMEVNASNNGDVGASVWTDWNILVDSSIFNDNDQDGTYLDSLHGDIMVACSDFWNNGDYGVDAVLPGTLGLDSDSFVGNGAGEYAVGGGGVASVYGDPNCNPHAEKTPVPTSTPDTRMTMNVVYVVDGQVVTLDCTAFLGTVLVLSNGDRVVLPCPITGQASLASVDSDELPAVLDTELAFVSAMDVQVSPWLDGVMLVDFVIPFGQADANFSILRWDDVRWADLRGVRTEEGFFEAASSQDGVFVLVTE